MVFDCLWMAVEFFEVVVDVCRSFLPLVTTQNEVNFGGEVGGLCFPFTHKFDKIYFPLTLSAAFSRTFTKIHESRMPPSGKQLVLSIVPKNIPLSIHYCEAESFSSPYSSSTDIVCVSSTPEATPL